MRSAGSAIGAGLVLLAQAGASHADDAAAFYAGKTMQVVIATAPGAAYDFYGRALARHIGRHVPGAPGVTAQNMPGASGFRAANHLYAAAPRDGLYVGTFNNAVAYYQAMGQLGVQYRAEEFSWIGAIPQDPALVAVWHATGVKTIEDAKAVQVAMGATGAGGNFAGHLQLLNAFLGTRFKIVMGYDGGNSINLAIERNEVSGKANTTWAAYKSIKPEWVRDGKIVPLVQFGAARDPELPHVPLLTELAQNDEQFKMFQLVSSTVDMGQPFAAPPGVPRERVNALRRAFEATLRDPAFRADTARLGPQTMLEPIPGETVAATVKRTVETPKDLVERLRAAVEPPQ
jgi:tripartite-type tricarboxylate transporter receptor subunit TctC